MNLQEQSDLVTAIDAAKQLERSGMTTRANEAWLAISSATAYEREWREDFGELIFDVRQSGYPRGSILRSRFILWLMAISFPTTKLVAAYFENLEQLFANRAKRTRPGDVVLGTGTGRCGSTTLWAAFAGLPDACATHENPPHMYWEPLEEQVQFHMDRLRLMADYFPLVFDSAHWWLNAWDRFTLEFPNGKMIGLARETEPCVQSFLTFHGRGLGSSNFYAPADNGVWMTTLWDPAYPSYPLPDGLLPDTDAAYAAKVAMTTRYVTEYNQTLRSLADANPRRLILIRTEALNDPSTTARLRALVAMPLAMPDVALNVGVNVDGSQTDCWF